MAALKVAGVEVRRGKFILGPLSLTIDSGRIQAFVGHNGSGKTTLFYAMSCLLRPVAGAITLADLDNRRDEVEFKREVGFVTDTNHVYPRMRVDQAIRFSSSSMANDGTRN